MAEKNDSGDRTEKPTEKRLRDARKKGDVSKSKDTTSTLVLAVWTVLAVMFWRPVLDRLTEPFQAAFAAIPAPTPQAFQVVAGSAGRAFLTLTLMFFVPVTVCGLLTEFVQAGPVFQFDKMKFKMDHLNPGEGLKRMFSTDNLMEVAKSLLKTILLTVICWVVVQMQFGELAGLATGDAASAMTALGHVALQLLMASVGAFLLVSALDAAYQKFSFTKKMRMSRRDIRQESKDAEGDPHIRAHRRQLHHEWANRNVVESARNASVLVVNPTHLAVALDYDPEEHPAPVVSAKGAGPLAAQMRAAAEEAGVPVIRNVEVARALHQRASLDDIIPKDMFAAVAEVILWARRMKEEAQRGEAEDSEASPGSTVPSAPPSEGAR